MARIQSLSVLDTESGKDYLAESYGKVIANVGKNTISSKLKNTDLSGVPGAGSVEAKRFVNRKSNNYGTARSGGKGQQAKAKAVTVAIDTDKELITEVEQKDVSLYGVDNFIERQVAMDEKSMIRELERDFFAKASAAGTKVTPKGTTPQEKLEELIQAVETVSNDYVDGVERDMIAVVCAPAFYGQIRTYLDNANHNTKDEEVDTYHGVKVYSSVYLLATDEAIAMAEGAVAQPVLPTVSNPAKIPLSNAYSFGMFYSYGTKAVTEDLIFKLTTA